MDGGGFNWSPRQIRKPPKIPTENASLFPEPLIHSLTPSLQNAAAGHTAIAPTDTPLQIADANAQLTMPSAIIWLLKFGFRATFQVVSVCF